MTRRPVVAGEVSLGDDSFIAELHSEDGSGFLGYGGPLSSWRATSPLRFVGVEVDRHTPALVDLATEEVTLVDVEGTARMAPFAP